MLSLSTRITLIVAFLLSQSFGVSASQTYSPRLRQQFLENGVDQEEIPAGFGLANYGFKPTEEDLFKDETAVIIFCYNRPKHLTRTLDSIVEHLPLGSRNRDKIFFYISQDGIESVDSQVDLIAKQYLDVIRSQGFRAEKWDHLEDVEVDDPQELGYARINANYKFGFNKIFSETESKRVIILEDDMEIAPDFFSFFGALSPTLDLDDSVLAISSWNDHGQEAFVKDPRRVYRTDFFPGLGWMMKKSLWEELGPKWPKVKWDVWLRREEQTKGRQSIAPEICRNFNLGTDVGVTKGFGLKDSLLKIKKNTEKIRFTELDFSFLKRTEYQKKFHEDLNSSEELKIEDMWKLREPGEGKFMIKYFGSAGYQHVARELGMIKQYLRSSGVPRQTYDQVIFVRFNEKDVYLVQEEQGLNPASSLLLL